MGRGGRLNPAATGGALQRLDAQPRCGPSKAQGGPRAIQSVAGAGMCRKGTPLRFLFFRRYGRSHGAGETPQLAPLGSSEFVAPNRPPGAIGTGRGDIGLGVSAFAADLVCHFAKGHAATPL